MSNRAKQIINDLNFIPDDIITYEKMIDDIIAANDYRDGIVLRTDQTDDEPSKIYFFANAEPYDKLSQRRYVWGQAVRINDDDEAASLIIEVMRPDINTGDFGFGQVDMNFSTINILFTHPIASQNLVKVAEFIDARVQKNKMQAESATSTGHICAKKPDTFAPENRTDL